MGSDGGFYYGFWEKNPKLWDNCKRIIAKQMIAEGWKTYAKKFDMVLNKRARKIWNSSI